MELPLSYVILLPGVQYVAAIKEHTEGMEFGLPTAVDATNFPSEFPITQFDALSGKVKAFLVPRRAGKRLSVRSFLSTGAMHIHIQFRPHLRI